MFDILALLQCLLPQIIGNPYPFFVKTYQQVGPLYKVCVPRKKLTVLGGPDGNPGVVYFVDDNFVGDRRAVMKLLPYLIN